MYGIAIDSLILFGLLQLLQGDAHELYEVVLTAIGMSVVNLVIVLALGGVIGIFAIVPMLIVDGLILMFYLRLPIAHAAIALAVLGGCKVAMALVLG